MDKIIEINNEFSYVDSYGKVYTLFSRACRSQNNYSIITIKKNGKEFKGLALDRTTIIIPCIYSSLSECGDYLKYYIYVEDMNGDLNKIDGLVNFSGNVIIKSGDENVELNCYYAIKIEYGYYLCGTCHHLFGTPLFYIHYIYDDIQSIYKKYFDGVDLKYIRFFYRVRVLKLKKENRLYYFYYSAIYKKGAIINLFDDCTKVVDHLYNIIYEKDGRSYLLDYNLKYCFKLNGNISPYISIDYQNEILIVTDIEGNKGALVIRYFQPNLNFDSEFGNIGSLMIRYEYVFLIDTKYKDIYRKGDWLVVKDSNDKQAVFSIKKREFYTDFCFDSKWDLKPDTIGEGLIGAHLHSDSKWNNCFSKPNLHYSFLTLEGECVYTLPSNMIIEKGFNKGKAVICEAFGCKYYLSNLWRFKEIVSMPRNNVLYEEEEDWVPIGYESSHDSIIDDVFEGQVDAIEI